MIGRRFVCENLGEIITVEVIEKSIEDIPRIIISNPQDRVIDNSNATSEVDSFETFLLCFRIDTRKIVRITEFDLLFDVTGLTQEQIIDKVEYCKNNTLLIQNRDNINEFDEHFKQCMKLGVDVDETIIQLKEMVDLKYRNIHGKNRN